MKNSLEKNQQVINVIINMERIRITSDSPGYVKVSDIGEELLAFSVIIEQNYSELNFVFLFCFRALYSTVGIRSKVRYEKDVSWLGMDLIMPLDEFNPYKNNVSMQRLIMGKYFFPFFSENIKKYKNKLPSLKPVAENLIQDMKLFLIDNLWLKDDENKLKISIIELVSYQRAMELFGNPKQKRFSNTENGLIIQELLWEIDKETTLLAQYKLIDKIWVLQSYKIE